MTMGYICPDCGEGLPEDILCPCTMGPDDEDEETARLVRGPLTAEIASMSAHRSGNSSMSGSLGACAVCDGVTGRLISSSDFARLAYRT